MAKMARRKRVAAYLRQPGRRGYRNGFPGRSNLDNEDDEDGFIKDSTLAPYIRNIIKQIDDQRRATAFKQLTLF